MTPLDRLSFSRKRAEQELVQFQRLLDGHSHSSLRERDHILPFFRSHRHLAALIGTWNFNIARPDRIAFEFDLFGDYKADLVVGDSENHQYCFVEFEDATATSIFKKTARATPDWSHRFEHGFSQIIDWILWLDNQRGTTAYISRFGASPIQFVALLVIGRDRYLEAPLLRERLTWRSEQVVVASRKVNCVTYDQLYRDLSARLKIFAD
jgi:Domain of unknown function (DUF4263)